MAINQNHTFEELDGVKCGIVEKNVKPARVQFLKQLLEHNGFTVVVAPTPPPKAPAAAPAPKPVATEDAAAAAVPPPPSPPPPPPPLPETFTVGVTDITFNSTNAIFGRLLHTPDGHVVTLAYWQQKDALSRDDVPYFQ
jgi:hypothetical protein